MARANQIPDHDGMVQRDRVSRWIFAIASGSVVLGAPTLLGATLGQGLFGSSTLIFGSIGFSVGIMAFLYLLPQYTVINSSSAAFVTMNPFVHNGNPYIPYGPGFHISFPWETREEVNNFPLDLITVPFTEQVPTRSAAVTVHGTIDLKFSLPHITQAIGIQADGVEAAIKSRISEWLSTALATTTPDQAKNSITKLRTEMETHFQEGEFFLDKYAMVVVSASISSIDLPPHVQVVRDGVDKAQYIFESVRAILGYDSDETFRQHVASGKITHQDLLRARDDLLVLSGNAKKSIKQIDIPAADEFVRWVAALTKIGETYESR